MILMYLITRRASFEFMMSLEYPSIFLQVYFVPAVIQGVLQRGHSLSGPPHESSSSPDLGGVFKSYTHYATRPDSTQPLDHVTSLISRK